MKGVLRLIERATTIGLLRDRLSKPYECYLPEKGADSERYPKILDVQCSVQNAKYSYMTRYIEEEIRRIPADEIAESHAKRFPTVLILGREQFLGQVRKQLQERGFSQIESRVRPNRDVQILDGYRMLAGDEASNLGWRIIIHAVPPADTELPLEQALTRRTLLRDELDREYVSRHLAIAQLLGDLMDGVTLSAGQIAQVEAATHESLESIRNSLQLPLDDADLPMDQDASGRSPEGSLRSDQPSVVCASLVGAKGLSAQHVFVVGMSNGLIPENPNAITNDEVSQLLVALSRTRKQCHLVSAKVWTGQGAWQPSRFLRWLDGLTELRQVNADTWKASKART